MNSVVCVFGTYNRREMLKSAVESVRKNAGVPIDFIIIDGGSTDGSREWLAAEPDVQLLGERGPLKGPVRAFNLGFAWAVEQDYPFVLHLNDDAVLETPDGVKKALDILNGDPSVGGVAFWFSLFPGGFDFVHGKPYSNFGLLRTEACMQVTKTFGDPTGTKWWDPRYRTYGADSELGARLWKGGWKILKAEDIQVRDLCAKDALRAHNEAMSPGRSDSKIFWSRWEKPESILPFQRADVMDWQGAKLHLGCGQKRLEGWINVDGIAGPSVDVVADALLLFRSIPQGSLKKIYTSHFIEHVPPDELPMLLALMNNAIAPGGSLRVATISFPGIYENRYLSQKNGGAWNSALYGETFSTDHFYAAHRQAFDDKTLAALLTAAGFKLVQKWDIRKDAKLIELNDYAWSCRLVTCFAEGIA